MKFGTFYFFQYPPGRTAEQVIREGVAKLAEVCHREFGVPLRSANVARR